MGIARADQPHALTPAEVATVLKIREREVRRLIRTGRLPALVLSRKCLRVHPAQLDAFLAGRLEHGSGHAVWAI